jgi:hypothetical protein
VKNVRAGQHSNTRFNVHCNLSNAEGNHTEVPAKHWLNNERSTHVEWCKWQFISVL